MKREFFKVKLAIFFGYNGTEYRGLQIQKEGVLAVENVLLDALLQANLLR